MNIIRRKLKLFWLKFFPGNLISLVVLCLCCINSAVAQNIWRLDVAPDPASAVLNVTALEKLAVGDSFPLRVDVNEVYDIRVDQFSTFANGDEGWYGSILNTGLDYALTITVGDQTAHLILTSPSGIFQFFGKKRTDGIYDGDFNRLEHVRDDIPTTDTIVPDGTDSQDNGDNAGNSDLVISQTVSDKFSPVGSKLTFDLTVSNMSLLTRKGLYMDIFFVLENTVLDSVPKDCRIAETTEMQPVLSCELADLVAGQLQQISFTVTTSENSHPLVFSTAVIEDEARSDLIIELYHDVLTDTDEDGISDFNEELLGTDPLNGLDALDRTAVIDVLVAYTPGTDFLYRGEVDTRINQLFNVANKIFEDSDTGIKLRPVGVHEVAYAPAENLFTDLTTATFQDDETLQDLARMRSLYGGDLVVLFRTGEVNGLCGLANLGGNGTQGDLTASYHRDFAYSVINIDCKDDSVLAHEVGHNLGLVHSRREDPDGGTLPYSAGFGEDTRFVSVMAFPDDFDVVNRLYRFSDPQKLCGQYACGADREDLDNGADAVSSLTLVKYQVENYFSSQEARIRTIGAVSSQEGAVNATLGVGVYSESSSNFGTAFSNSDRLDFRMKITPLPRHVGKNFTTHLVVMNGKNNLFQATADGTLVPLQKSQNLLNSLEALTVPRKMGSSELFDILKDVDFGSVGLSNTKVNIFIAYRMVDTGELIYGATPLRITLGL